MGVRILYSQTQAVLVTSIHSLQCEEVLRVRITVVFDDDSPAILGEMKQYQDALILDEIHSRH
jgi:hypothetical protein